MDRRAFITVMGGSLLAGPLVAAAEKGKLPRIGVIWIGAPPSLPPSPRPRTVEFRERLRELGYVEGQSIEIESRFVGDGTGLKQVDEDLSSLKVTVIVAMSTPPHRPLRIAAPAPSRLCSRSQVIQLSLNWSRASRLRVAI